MYEYFKLNRPAFLYPRCDYCGMKIKPCYKNVKKITLIHDGYDKLFCDKYYCDKDCAKHKEIAKRLVEEANDKLNNYIYGEED